jgi:hypothetical protein
VNGWKQGQYDLSKRGLSRKILISGKILQATAHNVAEKMSTNYITT